MNVKSESLCIDRLKRAHTTQLTCETQDGRSSAGPAQMAALHDKVGRADLRRKHTLDHCNVVQTELDAVAIMCCSCPCLCDLTIVGALTMIEAGESEWSCGPNNAFRSISYGSCKKH